MKTLSTAVSAWMQQVYARHPCPVFRLVSTDWPALAGNLAAFSYPAKVRKQNNKVHLIIHVHPGYSAQCQMESWSILRRIEIRGVHVDHLRVRATDIPSSWSEMMKRFSVYSRKMSISLVNEPQKTLVKEQLFDGHEKIKDILRSWERAYA